MKELLTGKRIILPTALVLALSNTLLASEPEKTPSIWDGDIATSIFAILLFGMLVFVLGKYAWGPILTGLKEREEHIRQQIKDAEQMKSDADKSLRRYEARLEKAEARAEEIIANAREEAESISKKITSQAQEKASEILTQTTSVINSAKEQAVRELHGYSVDLAVELASQILGRSIEPEDRSLLIQQAVEKINSK